ncbi:hypothetical protein [Methylomagnum ishizawai]|uniref:hypothetical protein n=1 Tax=Methylomagnum ishizawai TaxID=1760988 RepID=UPI001C818489|nr:hypothetical protein [Methylomagnum ishizawai]
MNIYPPRLVPVVFLLSLFAHNLQAASPVQIYATTQKTPAPQITLNLSEPNAWWGQETYTIYRTTAIGNFKGSWGMPVATIDTTPAATWTDTQVAAGTAYEYRVVPAWSDVDEAYILAGIELPQVESRGKIVLVVDNQFSAGLAFEIQRLERDLAGDGWTVLRVDVSRDEPATKIKGRIKALYRSDPANTVAVFLLGHIPVVHSGWMNPDQHGSRPAPTDAFYADMDGVWTDTRVNGDNRAIGGYDWWINVPRDGKFDQTLIPSDLELQVGRVDFYDMTAFYRLGATEQEMLRTYLDKDHAFRAKAFAVENRAAQMGSETGKYNFQQMFGTAPTFMVPDSNDSAAWFGLFEDDSYLWLLKGGGGGYYDGTVGIGSTADFARSPGVKIVFNSWFASFYSEWDVENAFLRAPLAAKGYGLVNFWSENPDWVLHQMALGGTIGAAARLSQNNDLYYALKGYPVENDPPMELNRRGVHLNLLGDPSLRMHIVAPPSNVRAGPSGLVTWDASPEAGLLGYDVYGGRSATGPFVRLNATPVSGPAYAVGNPVRGARYQVKAVKLDASSGSGTYLNTSVGVLDEQAPRALLAEPLASNQLRIVFDKALDQASAETPGHYAINNGVAVSSATLQSDRHTVVLGTTPHTSGMAYALTLQGLADSLTPPNSSASSQRLPYLYAERPEYSPDGDTTALWPLNGNGDDASGHGYTVTLGGDAAFTAPGKGVAGPSRECLKVSSNSHFGRIARFPGMAGGVRSFSA